MGDLTNKQIDLTYDGLIKTSDEQPIDGTLKTLQDGVGNDLPMQVSTTGVNFTGTVTGIPADTTYDLDAIDAAPNATVRLSGSDATTDDVNLIAGTNVSLDVSQNNITINSTGGTDTNTTYDLDFVPDGQTATIELNGSDLTTDVISIVPGNNVSFDLGTPGQFTINSVATPASFSDDSNESMFSNLTSVPATVTNNGAFAIAIGYNASVSGGNGGIAIGRNIVSGEGAVAIGDSAQIGDIYGTAIGGNARGGYFGAALGYGAFNNSNFSVAVGGDARTETDYGIAIGNGAQSRAQYNISMGVNSLVDDAVRVNTVVIGSGAGQTKAAQYSTAVGSQSIAVGAEASAFGYNAAANFNGSTAIGANTQAVADNTVTVKRLHWQDYASLNFPDDSTAAVNNIPLGGLYHNNGAVQIRIV